MNITGRLTRDAEVRTTPTGKQVVNFNIAVNDSYKNKQGERVEQTTFFSCSYWKSEKVLKMLTKGLLVELSGNVSARAWVSKDGEPRAQRLVITKVKSVAININQLECKNTFLYNNAYTHLHIEDSNLRFLKSSIFNSASQLAQYTVSFRDCILYNFNLPLIPENEKVTLSFEYNTFKKECSILTPDVIPASRNGTNEGQLNKEPTYILYLNYNNSEHPIVIGNLNEPIQNFIFIKSRRNNVCSYEISNLSVEKLSLNGDCTNTHITLDRINIKTQMEFSKFTGGEGSKFSNLIPCSSKQTYSLKIPALSNRHFQILTLINSRLLK